MEIIVWQSQINKIGGVETSTYNMCKQLAKHHDVTLLYGSCDHAQLERLKKSVKVEHYNRNKLYMCDVCYLNSSWAGYPESAFSRLNEYIQIIHADYEEMAKTGWTYQKWYRTTRHVAVSNHVRDIFNRMYNENATTMYNILDDIQPKRLKLISCTRLSAEKGYDRMVKLAEMLKEAKIPFEWKVYTDLATYKVKQYDYFKYMPTTFEIFDDIRSADYGVQLSNTEGDPYFPKECLQYGTPMLVTKFPSAYEQIIDGENGYILDFDLSNVDLGKITNNIPSNFNYKPKTTIEDWLDYLSVIERESEGGEPNMMEILITKGYDDTQLLRYVEKGEKLTVTLERGKLIVEKGHAQVVRVLKEQKLETREEKPKVTKPVKKGVKKRA